MFSDEILLRRHFHNFLCLLAHVSCARRIVIQRPSRVEMIRNALVSSRLSCAPYRTRETITLFPGMRNGRFPCGTRRTRERQRGNRELLDSVFLRYQFRSPTPTSGNSRMDGRTSWAFRIAIKIDPLKAEFIREIRTKYVPGVT